MMQQNPDFDFLVRLAEAAAAVVLPQFRTPLSADNKAEGAGFDPVTAADRAAEEAIRAIIGEAFPQDGIIGEEYGAAGQQADRIWVIDPIDGTRAFLAGIPVWGTLIGLLDKARPAFGVMSQPYIGEVFLGDGSAAELRFRGGRRAIRTRPAEAIGAATLMSTSPRLFTPEERQAYERLAAETRNERFGGDCYAYAMLAAGHVDLVVEAGLHVHDIVPLIPIIEGAGGVVSSWDGGSPLGGGRILAAADRRLQEEAIALLGE